jgi:hypothetical protein
VLLAALAASRSCASHNREVSQDEAVEIATEAAGFTPCTERSCVVVRAVQRGIPVRLYWIVGLAESLDESGRPLRFRNFVIDAETGDITQS